MFFCLHAPSTYNRRQKCLKYFAFPEFFSAAVAASFPPPSATKSILLCRTQSDLVENYKIEGGSWGRLEDRIKLIMHFKIWYLTMHHDRTVSTSFVADCSTVIMGILMVIIC